MAQIVRGLRDGAESGNTGAHGNKHMGTSGNQFWYRPDGREISVREVDEALVAAQDRIDEAATDLEGTQIRLEQAEQDVATVSDDLTRVETEVIPGAVADLEAADQAAAQELATLDGKLNTLDGVVEGKPDFDDLTVGNLLAGSVSAPEAVIDKLWADGIAARSVTAGSLTVSPGNMLSWHPRPDGSE